MSNADGPNLKEFLRQTDLKLSKYQRELADILIKYRVKHFSGGLRSGRTTVIDAVNEYFESKYFQDGMSREI